MSKLFGVSFAPICLPLSRRLQTFAVICLVGELFFLGLGGLVVLIYLLFTRYYLISVSYLIWMFYDNYVIRNADRMSRRVRKAKLFKLFADYFPISLQKTADLDINRNYIIGYHPHGIIPLGAAANFATDGTGFSQLYPGITSRVLTLNINFWAPIHREVMHLFGVHNVGKETIEYFTTKMGKGNAVVIVVGGASEALDAVPNTMELTLGERKGFVRLALKHGASLVPCISFGENELFQRLEQEGSWPSKEFQRKWTQILGIAPILFRGRGIFQYDAGFLPFRQPVRTVVGKPIHTETTPEPTADMVDKLHSQYIDSLTELFNEYKGKYASNPNLKLVIK